MGLEAACVGRMGGASSEGKAHLETDALVFRGAFRAKVPLAEVEEAAAEAGALRVRWPGGTLALELGEATAAKWADRIRNPRTRADKLGVKAGQRVSLLGVTDPDLRAELEARGADVSLRRRKDSDVLFAQVDAPAGLARLPGLVASMRQDGALWVVSPRGVPGLKDVDVMRAAKAAGLVDVKVVRFSETHSANKFVIPLARRK